MYYLDTKLVKSINVFNIKTQYQLQKGKQQKSDYVQFDGHNTQHGNGQATYYGVYYQIINLF